MPQLNRLIAVAVAGLLAQPLGAQPVMTTPPLPPPPPRSAPLPPPLPPASPSPPPVSVAAAPAKAHYALYDAIFSGFDLKLVAHNSALAIAQQLIARDPSLVRLQAHRPQLPTRIAATIEPYLALWMERVKDQRRGEGAGILAHHLTVAEAQRAANFYSSPLGQRMMTAMSGNLTFEQTLMAAQDPKHLSRSDAEQRDVKNAVSKTVPDLVASMTPAERQQVLKLMSDPFFPKLRIASAELARQPQPDFASFATADEQAAAKAALDQVITEELAAS